MTYQTYFYIKNLLLFYLDRLQHNDEYIGLYDGSKKQI